MSDDGGRNEAELWVQAARVRVLCVGDVMIDRFVSGTIERISPEAPVPVLRIEHSSAMPGGAGNVARNAAALGARVQLIGVAGDDDAGRELAGRLASEPGITPDLIVENGRQTTVKTRFIAASQQVLRADDETTSAPTAAVRDAVVAHVKAAVAGSNVLLLSDYAKGVLTDGLAERLIVAARASGLPVVVDPKGRDFRRYAGASIVTPNRRELADATGIAVGSPEQAIAAARRLMTDADIAGVVATLGRDGLIVVDGAGAAIHHPAVARDVFDVTGAGDTVVAALAVLAAAGLSLADAAAIANIAAGIVVGKVGTAVATAGEIEQAMRRREVAEAEGKLRSRGSAAEQAAIWRRQGLKVGFTNGCFDLVHPGHLSLLRQARAACDRLIVGLNSDASVSRLKGVGRPAQPEVARALVLAALTDVDLVVVFGEDTPACLIEALRPDVLVKGADYRFEDVVGGAFVRSYGGQVVLARIEPGYSTSATLARIAGDDAVDQPQPSKASTLPAR